MADKSNAARTEREDRASARRTPAAAKTRGGAGSEISATQLDRLIHERTRLAIVSALAANSSLSFTELRQLLGASDGNLSVHARKLEDAGYIACTKSFSDRVPRTEYRITASGRRALERYLDHMEALIRATREA
ncbi:MAG TPA: transcriptional regulator [Candidatus Acidoferrales bacterium]|nr:transcriptional regulator [Candidatus Acidoferrales bacterium]